MPNETMEKLSQKLWEKVGDSAAYQGFLNAILNAEERISQLHAQDRYGRVRKMTQEDADGLMGLLKQVGLKAEDVYRDEADAETRQLVKKITALAAGTHRAMLTYEPDKAPRTLPSLLREVRTLTLDTRGMQLNHPIGNNQNKRQPLTFLDSSGREVTGVFTPKKVADSWDSIARDLKALADSKKTPAAARPYFSSFMDLLDTDKGARALGLPENADRSERLSALSKQVLSASKETRNREVWKLLSALHSTPEKPVTPEQIQRQMGAGLTQQLTHTMFAYGTQILNNNRIAKIHDGARMDSRNAAMSAVAELLNVAKLLAKSVPMKIIDKDGNEIEGTFMMAAKGVDPGNLSAEDAKYGEKSLERNPGKAMKSLADLQVLDYICGNTDRHGKNMCYQFDDEGNFVGVQGFDNDTAFGTIDPKTGDFVSFFPMLENMKGISQSMYDRLCQVTPEMLKFSLRGFGLTEQELDAAAKRMQNLKEAIRKGMDYYARREADRKAGKPVEGEGKNFVGSNLRVMKDEEWNRVSWDELKAHYSCQRLVNGEWKQYETSGNHFTKAQAAVKLIPLLYRKQSKQYVELRSKVAIGAGNRAIPTEQAKEAARARKLAELMEVRTTQGRSSPQYDAMQEAAEQYALFQIRLKNRMAEAAKDSEDPDAPYESVVRSEDLEEMRRLAKDLQDKAKAYLEHKGGGLHSGYANKRIEAAKLAYKLGEDGAKLKPEEVETSEHSMKAALEEVNRRVGDRLEASQWSSGKQTPFQKTDFDAVPREPEPRPRV